MKCCICGKEIEGYGNSALPLVEGVCCDACNHHVVIPARIFLSPTGKGFRDFIMNENPKADVGAKVLILEMQGEADYFGKVGIIEHIDSIGQLHGTWGGCALIPTTDTYFVIDEGVNANG